MAKVKKETIGKINDFLDNLEQNEQARFDKCTLCNTTLLDIVKKAEVTTGAGMATVCNMLSERVNDGAAPADVVSGKALKHRVAIKAGDFKSSNRTNKHPAPDTPDIVKQFATMLGSMTRPDAIAELADQHEKTVKEVENIINLAAQAQLTKSKARQNVQIAKPESKAKAVQDENVAQVAELQAEIEIRDEHIKKLEDHVAEMLKTSNDIAAEIDNNFAHVTTSTQGTVVDITIEQALHTLQQHAQATLEHKLETVVVKKGKRKRVAALEGVADTLNTVIDSKQPVFFQLGLGRLCNAPDVKMEKEVTAQITTTGE